MPRLCECPYPEMDTVFALLLENKLDETKRANVLRHIADCDGCAMAYSIAREMQKKPTAKAKPVLFTLRYLSNAAAIVLLAGASFIGGFLYSRQSEYERIVQRFESSPLYWSNLESFVRQENPSTQETRVLSTRGGPNVPSAQEILTSKKDFDQRLSEIVNLSGKEIDAILSVDGLNIRAMTPEDIIIYSAILKDGRVKEIQKAQRWLRFDQSAYFSLFERLPSDVWERYPANEESFKTLAWIAGLPEEKKKKILALSPENAAEEKRQEETQLAP